MNRSQKQVLILTAGMMLVFTIVLVGLVYRLDFVSVEPESLRPKAIFSMVLGMSVCTFFGCMAWSDEA